MEDLAQGLVFAGTLDELKDKGRLLVRGHQRPILLLYDQGRVFALDILGIGPLIAAMRAA